MKEKYLAFRVQIGDKWYGSSICLNNDTEEFEMTAMFWRSAQLSIQKIQRESGGELNRFEVAEFFTQKQMKRWFEAVSI